MFLFYNKSNIFLNHEKQDYRNDNYKYFFINSLNLYIQLNNLYYNIYTYYFWLRTFFILFWIRLFIDKNLFLSYLYILQQILLLFMVLLNLLLFINLELDLIKKIKINLFLFILIQYHYVYLFYNLLTFQIHPKNILFTYNKSNLFLNHEKLVYHHERDKTHPYYLLLNNIANILYFNNISFLHFYHFPPFIYKLTIS